jgi:ComF family protein
VLSGLWSTLLNLVYPPKCPLCRAGVAGYGAWCPACSAGLLAPRLLDRPGHRLHWLQDCYVVCHYSGGLKRLLHDMKFRRADRYAAHLRYLLAAGTADFSLLPDAVIPVPLHTARQGERGYNQTELIFRPWVRDQGWPWVGDALIRKKNTAAQWQLSLAARRENIKGAFMTTRPEWLGGKRILLVDDIFTSGATMEECAKMLRQAGALEVRGLALASGAL